MKKTYSYTPYGSRIPSTVMFCRDADELSFPKTLKTLRRIVFIYDATLRTDLVQQVIRTFQNTFPDTRPHALAYGPKSLENLQKIWKSMVTSVPDCIVGMGGGTTTDLVGFAASTYQRGIPHMLVPTTVLSMIDASIGGKTGIDFGGVKNSIGALHYPLMVMNCMKMLESLSKDEFFSGFAEAVKAAVLFDANYFQDLEIYADGNNFDADNPKLFNIMVRSALLKMENSELPPKHKIKLLYGHAIAHGIEIMGTKRVRHGDAVAIGMTIEGALACLLGIWNKEEWLLQTQLLKNFHLPVTPATRSRDFIDTLTDTMSLYRKLVFNNDFGFVFPSKLGHVETADGNFITYIPRNRMKTLLHEALTFAGKNIR
jgi:3-dehydroquinate synthase